jgi:hypothetical protein
MSAESDDPEITKGRYKTWVQPLRLFKQRFFRHPTP